MDIPVNISVAAPAYNEAESIAAAVREWQEYLEDHPSVGEWEIVVCDDGSGDATGEILAALRARCPRLVVVTFERNRGAGAAIAAAGGLAVIGYLVLPGIVRAMTGTGCV